MSRVALVAGRYARALFMVAERRGEIFEVFGDLQALLGIVQADSPVGAFLRSPLVPVEQKRALLKKGLEGRSLRPVAGFVDLLLRKKRLTHFPDAVAEYEKIVRRWQGLQEAEVVSAVPLTEPEMKRVHAELEKLTGLTIEMHTRVDPDLIGGLYARIGDRVIDRSVKGLLASLKERLFEVSV